MMDKDESAKKNNETLEDELKKLIITSPGDSSSRVPGERRVKPIALVEWEDISAYTRVEMPVDFESFRLKKVTFGILWHETEEYVVLVQDFDLSNKGKRFRHNDFHIFPRGAIKKIKIISELEM